MPASFPFYTAKTIPVKPCGKYLSKSRRDRSGMALQLKKVSLELSMDLLLMLSVEN